MMNNPASSSSSPTQTTFVQADTATFRDLVQKLTGSSTTAVRRSPFKLQDRRKHTITRKLEIQLGLTDSPIQSPITPLRSDSVFSANSMGDEEEEEEEKAIAEKRFYLHPSPLSTPRASEPPELLTLFPLTSPRK
ncbi:hypothetical protein LguiA_036600 [Lonicera macranthoides]